MHTNICGPFNVQACGGYANFITFTNDYSRYAYIDLMHRKSDALDKFKEFKVKSKNQLGKQLEAFQSDLGGVYLSKEFDFFLKKHEIYPN